MDGESRLTPDLSFLPTEALLDEVLRRFDCGAFFGGRDLQKGVGIYQRGAGNSATLLGVIQLGVAEMVQDLADTSEQGDV